MPVLLVLANSPSGHLQFEESEAVTWASIVLVYVFVAYLMFFEIRTGTRIC